MTKKSGGFPLSAFLCPTMALAALKEVNQETGGEVKVYGTPGEEGRENRSAKGSFVREGFFWALLLYCLEQRY